ncbi:MAG: branched-chain amino acid transaminase [Nisaea sp.]|uniref:branched-chain amino acid transaminase n=1 Tax=Nisaea sp. TaxID=2024842 RepID=UPI001B09C79E|nr:branched-chain amino acid transaminase [Nisaea sp.]MBO6561276.1 branched-chain amino acid transaminase [Nisaea sp.]
MSTPKYAVIDGEIVEWDNATVHVASAAFKFGTTVFEGLRAYWNEQDEDFYLFRMHEHMDRLDFSQRFMRFDGAIPADLVTEKTLELLKANKFAGTNLHIMTSCYVAGMGGPGACGPVGLAITALERPRSANVLNGISAQVSSWMRVPDNAMPMRVKCNANYNNGRLATVQATVDGYDTAIFLNSRGKVAEGPGMCFFMVRNGQVITPDTSNDILESITRDTVLQLAREAGYETVERSVDRSELAAADEAFFCGTAWEVTPILSIDRLPLSGGAIGPVTKKLQQTYIDVCEGRTKDHADWRLPVYKGAAAKAAE